MEKTKNYYVLSIDNYGQPNGIIKVKQLTKEEAEHTPYCYPYTKAGYRTALYRAHA